MPYLSTSMAILLQELHQCDRTRGTIRPVSSHSPCAYCLLGCPYADKWLVYQEQCFACSFFGIHIFVDCPSCLRLRREKTTPTPSRRSRRAPSMRRLSFPISFVHYCCFEVPDTDATLVGWCRFGYPSSQQ